MLSTEEAFAKFRSRLELTKREQESASRRQQEVRAHLNGSFDIEHDFLTGSYKRHTKTKPLKDVDIFCVLGDEERHYRDEPPGEVLSAFENALVEKYGRSAVIQQRRSVCVDFAENQDDEKVLSCDVVPAFAVTDHYEICDQEGSEGWIETNPRAHEDLAVEAHAAFSKEWKGLVRMMKYWNNNNGKPIKPSFLIEVMALEVLHSPYGGQRHREMQFFFASLASRIGDTWPDPAGLGPPVSDSMDSVRIAAARKALASAEYRAARAIDTSRAGRQGDALRQWRNLFGGTLFPLS